MKIQQGYKKIARPLFALCLFVLMPVLYASDKYYLITHGSQDPYWQTLFQGAQQAARDLHIELQILAPAGANDVVRQLQFLDSALATHPQGIATTIPSETAFSKSLQRARNEHIPVIAFDTRPANQDMNPYLAFAGSDNERSGKSLASIAIKDNLTQGEAVILNPQPGHTGLAMRAHGIKTVLQHHHIATNELDTGADPIVAQQRIKAWFRKHPQTSLVFCLTSQALDPLGQMMLHQENNQFPWHPEVYSFDKTPNTVKLMQQSIVKHAIDQQPFLMGYFSISQLVLHKRYGINPVKINTAF